MVKTPNCVIFSFTRSIKVPNLYLLSESCNRCLYHPWTFDFMEAKWFFDINRLIKGQLIYSSWKVKVKLWTQDIWWYYYSGKKIPDVLFNKFDPKTAVNDPKAGPIWPSPSCGFWKSVSSKERVKPWFFVTFNIIIRQIFPENFIEIPQVV